MLAARDCLRQREDHEFVLGRQICELRNAAGRIGTAGDDVRDRLDPSRVLTLVAFEQLSHLGG